MRQMIRVGARPGLTLLVLAAAVALLAALGLLAACAGGAPAPTQVPPSAVPPATEPAATAVPPTQEPTATLAPTEEPTDAPTETPTQAPTEVAAANPDASTCIACHTSEESLQKLAVEEEPAEKLSEGEG